MKKRISFLIGTVLMAVGIVTFSSFTSDSYKKDAFALVCFEYVGTMPATGHPSFDDIDNEANWVQDDTPECSTPLQVICAICFNTSTYALHDGKPPFSTNATFSGIVEDHYDVPADDGDTYSGITFEFRAR